MSELTDLILKTTDPIVALLILGLGGYIRSVKKELRNDISQLRKRAMRLENAYIPDGGEEENHED